MIHKNRDRKEYTFANINLLGHCNLDCFFCLGKDLDGLLPPTDYLKTHFHRWMAYPLFLKRCRELGIKKIYITGQTADSLQYEYLDELVDELQGGGFFVGLRTNGIKALQRMHTINKCKLGASYTIHGLDPVTVKMITGKKFMLPWEEIFAKTTRPRAAIVVNRCNEHQILALLDYCTRLPNVTYVQVRQISTDTRFDLLQPDIDAFERFYRVVKPIMKGQGNEQIFKDADVFEMHGKDVVFWRTVRTDANSINYFTDGTLSEEYFIVEGYTKQHGGNDGN